MQYTRLGSSGLKISRIAMGTMSFGEGDSGREGLPIPTTTMAQVALAWVLKNPVVDAPIVGVTKQHHLVDAAALDLELTDDEVTALEEPYVLRQATWF
jgi:aryl-alcohol dehydrogenase-like predicted oxidoreductase